MDYLCRGEFTISNMRLSTKCITFQTCLWRQDIWCFFIRIMALPSTKGRKIFTQDSRCTVKISNRCFIFSLSEMRSIFQTTFGWVEFQLNYSKIFKIFFQVLKLRRLVKVYLFILTWNHELYYNIATQQLKDKWILLTPDFLKTGLKEKTAQSEGREQWKVY